MSETHNVDITPRQQDLILQGLRYVRSSVQMEIREPSPEVSEDRKTRMQEIDSLVAQLSGTQTAPTAASV